MSSILIPSEYVEVISNADICVVGGSCTGVFAAIRAARLGAKVVIVEKQNRFGGVATCGLVSMWHSIYNLEGTEQIIAGLNLEVMERLEKRGAIDDFRDPTIGMNIRLNSEELTLELDEMVCEHSNIRMFLQTNYSRPILSDDGTVDAIITENKSGRFAIKSKFFIDATGDGLLCRDTGFPMFLPSRQQPPTTCARFEGWDSLNDFDLKAMIDLYKEEIPNLPGGYAWGMTIPNSTTYMLAGTRIFNCDCSNADAITNAELESRKQIRAIMDLIRKVRPETNLTLQALPSAIGLRESYHIQSINQLTGEKLLSTNRPADAIANGTYPVDIHNDTDETIAFKRLNGVYDLFKANKRISTSRWLPEGQSLPFYQIPLSCLIPKNSINVIAAGRMLDADREAFGAVRVMVNLNQCGEAAGVAAWQAINKQLPIAQVDVKETRELLAKGGSIVI